MVDNDRDRETVERTTIVETGGDRGSGGVIAVVLLIVAILALLFLFKDSLGFGSKTTTVDVPDSINVNVN